MIKRKLVLKTESVRVMDSLELREAQGGLPNVSELESNCWRCTSAIGNCPRTSIDLACPTTGDSRRGCTFDFE